MSKLIEHVVCDQLTEYTAKTGNIEPLQSAYKKKITQQKWQFSRLRQTYYNCLTGKKLHVTCLILLDLSMATFYTVDHKLLIHKLEHRFGIKDTALRWIKDYITDHIQQVVLDNSNCEAIRSKPAILT